MSDALPETSIETFATAEPARTSAAPAPKTTWGWIREGLRAGVFLKARPGGQAPAPVQLVIISVLLVLLEVGPARLEIPGPAVFDLPAWLAPWWGTSVLVLVAWWVLTPAVPVDREPARPAGVATWFALWLPATVPANLVAQALGIAHAHELLPAWMEGSWLGWAVYLLLWVWTLAVALKLTWQFMPRLGRTAAFGAAMVVVFGLTAWQFPGRPWQAVPELAEDKPAFVLSQETFETQQQLLAQSIKGLAPGKQGVANVYGLVFAPYAQEDVFLRESTMVAKLLEERFDAKGRVLHLINNATTTESNAWATPANLQLAIDGLAARMNLERDVLVLYLTSHGASDFKLAADHAPLAVDSISPGELRAALDKAGIKNRVIAISACYSGGWIGPLGNDTTLVMTAADATHTSYGCGRLSPLTFFGRAMFDEQLRQTHSFETAFAAAVPLIRQREIDAGKKDGFSNPQISVGEKIRPVLAELEKRLH